MLKHGSKEFSNKKILIIAPHIDDEAIGCGAFLFSHNVFNQIYIAYAVSGFRGVTDAFADGRNKSVVRQNEGIEFCKQLGFIPHFWDLPFYEKGLSTFGRDDVAVAKDSLQEINPDFIFICDEDDDPHGTHGIVREVVLKAILELDEKPMLIGYRVWGKQYIKNESDMVFGFDEQAMKQKEKLIKIYKSQIDDPAYPPESGESFIEMVRRLNAKTAKENRLSFSFAESFKYL